MSRQIILSSAALTLAATIVGIAATVNSPVLAKKPHVTPQTAGTIGGQGSTFADILLTGGAANGCPGPATPNSWLNVFGNNVTPSGSNAGNGCGTTGAAINGTANISYGATGSGGGRTAFLTCIPATTTGETLQDIDFAVTDTPYTKVNPLPPATVGCKGNAPIVQVPLALGAVAVSYNLNSNIGNLANVTRADLCGIFDGSVTTYSGHTIKGFSRFGTSGTTGILTKHLDAVCPAGPAPFRPAGETFGDTTKGQAPLPANFTNAGITSADLMATNVNSNNNPSTTINIGYLDGALAKLRTKYHKVANNTGAFISPIISAGITAAATGVKDIDSSKNRIELNIPANPTSAKAYPIVGTTYAWYYGEVGGSSSYDATDRSVIFDHAGWFTHKGTTATEADKIITNLGGYGPLPKTGSTGGTTYVSNPNIPAAACPANSANSVEIKDLVYAVIKGCV